jgi:hypothetical protein
VGTGILGVTAEEQDSVRRLHVRRLQAANETRRWRAIRVQFDRRSCSAHWIASAFVTNNPCAYQRFGQSSRGHAREG